jgi:hypothetical protein
MALGGELVAGVTAEGELVAKLVQAHRREGQQG